MISLNHFLRKYTAGYKISKSQEKINHLMHMDDIKLFAKNGKELEILKQAVRVYTQDIRIERLQRPDRNNKNAQSVYRYEFWHKNMQC